MKKMAKVGNNTITSFVGKNSRCVVKFFKPTSQKKFERYFQDRTIFFINNFTPKIYVVQQNVLKFCFCMFLIYI